MTALFDKVTEHYEAIEELTADARSRGAHPPPIQIYFWENGEEHLLLMTEPHRGDSLLQMMSGSYFAMHTLGADEVLLVMSELNVEPHNDGGQQFCLVYGSSRDGQRAWIKRKYDLVGDGHKVPVWGEKTDALNTTDVQDPILQEVIVRFEKAWNTGTLLETVGNDARRHLEAHGDCGAAQEMVHQVEQHGREMIAQMAIQLMPQQLGMFGIICAPANDSPLAKAATEQGIAQSIKDGALLLNPTKPPGERIEVVPMDWMEPGAAN